MFGSRPRGVGAPYDWALLLRRARDFAGSALHGQEVEDVAQQSMLEFWQHVRAGDEIVNPTGLLATIVARRVRSFVMRRGRLMLHAEEALDRRASRWAPDPVEEMELSEELESARGWLVQQSCELVHEAVAGGGAEADEPACAWSTELLAEAQRAYRKRKKSTPDPARSGDREDGWKPKGDPPRVDPPGTQQPSPSGWQRSDG